MPAPSAPPPPAARQLPRFLFARLVRGPAYALLRRTTIEWRGLRRRLGSRGRSTGPADLRVLFYSPANLNTLDGSTIWVQAVSRILALGGRARLTIPLRAAERRDLVTGPLRAMPEVRIVDRTGSRRWVGRRPSGMTPPEAADVLEWFDAAERFDVVLLRGYRVCLAAARRRRFRGRLWSAYVVEPELDLDDPEYRAGLAAIASASRYLLAQTEAMRRLTEEVVPGARGRTILLPPAIPDEPVARADPDRPVRRMIYTGKFHPFYAVEQLIDMLTRLRVEMPDLEFHVAGDKIMWQVDDTDYRDRMERLLRDTPGLVWHGGLDRQAVERLTAQGGVALSVWDGRFGPTMNGLVMSTKLLDYASVGVPVVLTRTPAQEELLGADYPLFVDAVEDALPAIRRALNDPALYRAAAGRTFEASRPYTYSAVRRRLDPYLPEPGRAVE